MILLSISVPVALAVLCAVFASMVVGFISFIVIKEKANKKALLVIDMQNDFMPGGSLPVAAGNGIVHHINQWIQLMYSWNSIVIYSRDWHKPDTPHFKKWLVHCVQDTPGAAFHPNLLPIDPGFILSKGMTDDDGYSAFHPDARISGMTLAKFLKAHGIKTLYIAGVATDYCVHDTVMDACTIPGLTVCIITDAIAAVDETKTPEILQKFKITGACLNTTLFSEEEEGLDEDELDDEDPGN